MIYDILRMWLFGKIPPGFLSKIQASFEHGDNSKSDRFLGTFKQPYTTVVFSCCFTSVPSCLFHWWHIKICLKMF